MADSRGTRVWEDAAGEKVPVSRRWLEDIAANFTETRRDDFWLQEIAREITRQLKTYDERKARRARFGG